MRAVVINSWGGPEELTEVDVPPPACGPGQILVRTAASAVNPVDLQVRSGAAAANVRAPFPMVLGWDLSGTVTEVGAHVTGFVPGDAVVAMSAQAATAVGTLAEYVALDSRIAARAPRNVALSEAAALPLAGLTAHQALERLAPAPGGSVLITGAAGAVGGFAVQLAAARGLHVVGHGREGDESLLKELGAAQVVTTERPAAPGSVDYLFETAGLTATIAAVRDGGRAVSIVGTAPPQPERGIDVRMSFVDQDGARLTELVTLVEAGVLTVRVAEVLDFARAGVAHQRLADGGVRGKLLLTP